VGALCSIAIDVKVSVLAVTGVAIKLVDAVCIVVAIVLAEKTLVRFLLAFAISIDIPAALEHAITITALLAGFAVWLVERVAFVVWFALVAGVTSFALAIVTLALCVAFVVVAARISCAWILVAFLLTLAVSVLYIARITNALVLGAAIVLAG